MAAGQSGPGKPGPAWTGHHSGLPRTFWPFRAVLSGFLSGFERVFLSATTEKHLAVWARQAWPRRLAVIFCQWLEIGAATEKHLDPWSLAARDQGSGGDFLSAASSRRGPEKHLLQALKGLQKLIFWRHFGIAAKTLPPWA